ncbi:unnamed protein product [Caenorhabditis bovis]|uniref:dihydrofolate reductase n=1 Tax=Caenorhabditis bovis TaxID=2654633 RepID=A0A8S1F627_9PELO|nr:unnamed protein product [Caenorhabditis bovis]
MASRKMKLIVAMDSEGGIGKNGTLPWHISKDLKRFAALTRNVMDKSKKNAVIMGRKCWDSIPDGRKPLKDRFNIIMSRKIVEVPGPDTVVIDSLDKLKDFMNSESSSINIETFWNIGGTEIYEMALHENLVDELYITKIFKSFDTDVKLSIDWSKFDKSRKNAAAQQVNGNQATAETQNAASSNTATSNTRPNTTIATTNGTATASTANTHRPAGQGNTNNRQNQPKRDKEKSTSQNSTGAQNAHRKNEQKNEGLGQVNGRQNRNNHSNSFVTSNTGSAKKEKPFNSKNLDSSSHRNGNASISNPPAAPQTSTPSQNPTKESVAEEPASTVQDTIQRQHILNRRIDKNTKDLLLTFISQSGFDKLELITEMLTLLSPYDLRYVGNLVEGMIRTNSLQFKPYETLANSDNPMACFPPPEIFVKTGGTDVNRVFQPQEIDDTVCRRIKSMDKQVPNLTSSLDSYERTNALSNKLPPPVNKPQPTKEEEVYKEEEPIEKPLQIFGSLERHFSAFYLLVSLLSSTNRKSAGHIFNYLEVAVLQGKDALLEFVPNVDEKIVLIDYLGQLAVACIHHPAFSVKDKLQMITLRDELRCTLERLYASCGQQEPKPLLQKPGEIAIGAVDDSDNEEANENEQRPFVACAESSSHAVCGAYPKQTGPFVYIQRFIGSQVDEQNPNHFLIEIRWSDGETTFTHRSRDQLKVLQHRLLDEFGQQRSEKHTGMVSSVSSIDEEQNKRLSTSTLESPANFTSSRRILPHLLPDASTSEVIQYINELSDLPARMILSRVICEEFNATRNRSNDDECEFDGIIFAPKCRTFHQNRSHYGRFQSGSQANHHYVITPPLAYSPCSLMHQHQLVEPSCSTCGGEHTAFICNKPSLFEKKSDFRINVCSLVNDGSAPPPVQYALPNQQLPVGIHALPFQNGHFIFHQQQQRQHQQMFSNQGSSRMPPNGYEMATNYGLYSASVPVTSPPTVSQPPVATSTSTSMNSQLASSSYQNPRQQ